MILEKLTLKNFRNYRNCTLEFSPGLNFLYGENGNGKTNLLEAISLLSYTKSFLQNQDADCVLRGENFYEALGFYSNEINYHSRVFCRFTQEGKELIHNNEKINRFSSFLGEYPLIVYSPKDIKLTTGSPSDRRRNFDMLIAQTSSVYLNDLRNYNRIIKQKNSLLKNHKLLGKTNISELRKMIELWNNELADLAVKIIIRRLDFIDTFKELMTKSFRKLIKTDDQAVLRYKSEFVDADSDTLSSSEIKDSVIRTLSKKSEFEILRGISLSGPHKDNYIFELKKGDTVFEVKNFASQGEHKTFVIALKLAEFEYIRSNTQHTFKGNPILLLDDVFSELDDSRAEKVCDAINGFGQIFVTSAGYRYADLLRSSYPDKLNVFKITNGIAEHVS